MLVVWWREERVRDDDDEKKGMEKKQIPELHGPAFSECVQEGQLEDTDDKCRFIRFILPSRCLWLLFFYVHLLFGRKMRYPCCLPSSPHLVPTL